VPGGAFNVAALIAELGLKPVGPDEMRIRGDIQPVMVAADLRDLTPPHVPASALFGLGLVGAGLDAGIIEVQCLARGGAFVDWLTISSAVSINMFIRATGSAGLAPQAAVAQVSRDAIVSVAESGDIVPIAAFSLPVDGGGSFFNFDPAIFIPRGNFFVLQLALPAQTGSVGFAWREVPAAENL